MQVVTGKSIVNGIAIGPVRIYSKTKQELPVVSALTGEQEWNRFEAAQSLALEQLETLYAKALAQAGEDSAAIFKAHQMILEDGEYTDAIRGIIESRNTTAEYAVAMTGERFAARFAAMDDGYLQAREADIKDISQRLVDILSGQTQAQALGEEPVILAADDLTPGEMVQLDKDKLLGLLIRHGSANSHTAILARAMNIPAMIGVDFARDWDGKLAALDGYHQCVYLEPTPELLAVMEERRNNDRRNTASLQELKNKPNVTLDGQEIDVFANIGNVRDVELALQNDAGGIGLFRSEFIFLEARDCPGEETQFAIYRQVVEQMAGKRVIIRTLDMGSDKQAEYFNLDKEENPALGYRGIRISLTRKDMFRQQLRAILRASAYGTVSVMFPMIISVREVREAKALLEECRAELREEGRAVGQVEVGIMVETPAAVMMADELAEEVDFFSLGTNDLTQYTLALDRQNPKLEAFFDSHHPAILKMIQQTVLAGHRHGCRVGICGELGVDLALTESFLRMGVDELSVSPAAVLPLRGRIRSLDLSEEG